MQIKFDGAPVDQTRDIPIDACNLGQGATQYFLAADLMEKHRITSVLVVDDAGLLVGALNSNDLMRAKVI